VVRVRGSELGESQEQPGNVVLCAIVNEVEVLRVDGHALQDGRHPADDDESNVVAGEDFNQPEESVLQLASHFRQADASPRVPASTRAECRGGKHARDFNRRRCGHILCSVEPRLRGLRTRLTPCQICATKQHPDFAPRRLGLGRSSRRLNLLWCQGEAASVRKEGTLRRARRALAPRPALRVPGARSAKGASTTGRTTTLTARSNPSNPLGRAKDFRANNWAQDDAARKSARVTIRIIGSSGEASKPNRK